MTESVIDFPRWRVLIAAIVVMLCTGSTYAFSVLIGPLAAVHHWSAETILLAFTINMAIAPIPMIISGKIVDKNHARACVLAGGVLYGIGYFLMGMSNSILTFYLSYGLICGFATAFAYSGCLGNITRLFPDKRGLAIGLVTAGNGGSAIIFAPLLSFLIQSNGVLFAIRLVGCIFVVVCLIAGLLTRTAPTDYRPKGWAPPSDLKTSDKSSSGLPWYKMLGTLRFYLIFIIFGIGTLSGLMIVSNLARIGQSMFALSATVAALYVSFYSLSNCLGRIVWGAISDKIGRYFAMMSIFIVIGIMLMLMAQTASPVVFLVSIIGIGLCFGGTMGIMPPIVTENFGTKYYGVNYGVTFIGYAAAAFFGPRLAVTMAQANHGNFSGAFYIAMFCSLIGIAAIIVYLFLSRKVPTHKTAMTKSA
ncbi:MAG: OFA family MFS transporter [Sporolactobacillus sp.]